MGIDEFINRAISVPFVVRGRSFDGWDCYGLIVRAYRELYGIDIPDYVGRYDPHDFNAVGRLFFDGLPKWERLPEGVRETGDVALIFHQGRPIHCGLVVGGGRRILHAEEGVGTVSERISRFRIEGIYGLK